MSEEIPIQSVPPAAAPSLKAKGADPDLSGDIERAVEKQTSDRVRCVRVFEGFYRCNWWAPAATVAVAGGSPGFNWSVATTHLVRQSRFLTASVVGERLVITEVKRRSA